MGATLPFETTAVATGDNDVIRCDPFAVLPFLRHYMEDYFKHWIRMGNSVAQIILLKIFYVIWIRRKENGKCFGRTTGRTQGSLNGR
jgi:phosphoenolpyruvate carboxykinase (GTP)